MLNYEDREAAFPSDKASCKVLISDYFHDSLITSVSIAPEKQIFEMRVQCSRECEWETGDFRRDIYNEKYGYVLTFSGVAYLDIKTDLTWTEYINGRFKAIPKGRYYFRIQTADGYIDIGYRGFMLRKLVGRVSYRDVNTGDPWICAPSAVSQDEIDAILRRIDEDGYTEEQDFDLFMDLEKLYASGAPELAERLRRIVALPWESEDAIPYAAWLLGKYGSAEDMPLISRLLGRECANEFKRVLIIKNLSDAIDALSERG